MNEPEMMPKYSLIESSRVTYNCKAIKTFQDIK